MSLVQAAWHGMGFSPFTESQANKHAELTHFDHHSHVRQPISFFFLVHFDQQQYSIFIPFYLFIVE
jgi:hypothetical protein